MSSPFEKFIQENRDQFDSEIPDSKILEQIKRKIQPKEKKGKLLLRMPVRRWFTAAAIVIFITGTVVFYSLLNNHQPVTGISKTEQAEKVPEKNSSVASQHVDSDIVKPGSETVAGDNKKTENNAQAPAIEGSKEMYYYAKLIEIKQEELKTLEKDEPLLYKQFASDVEKLDKVYHSLKTQLPENSNQEQIIEAMVSNLQLQINLLNKQLKIIKQIKHSKKAAYENAYKSI
jgi:hypothetical protein